jgi:hypothetical protein
MTLLERMDNFCRWAFLDRVSRPRPRPFRWLPVFALIAIIGGYALIEGYERTHSLWRLLAGLGFFFGGNLAAVLLRMIGPRLANYGGIPLDERELLIKARANAVSGMTLSVTAMAGCFYMGFATFFPLWRPLTMLDWIYLGLTLQNIAIVLPTLIASWLQPRPDADEE